MSGEGGGAIIGGLFIFGMAPAILGGTVVIGGAYGVLKLTQVLGSSAYRGYQRKKEKEKIEVNNCSRDLSVLYDGIQSALERQEQQDREYYEKLAAEMQQAAENLKEITKKSPDTKEWERKLSETRNTISGSMGRQKAEALQKIREQTKAEVMSYIKKMDELQESEYRLVSWEKKTAEAKALQKTMAGEMMRDARASVRILNTLSKSNRSEGLIQRTQMMERRLQSAENAFAAEIYDTAAANAQKIISTCAALVLEHAQEELETVELRLDLEAKVSGLLEEVKRRRVIHFKDTMPGTKGEEIYEDLNDFSQGHIEELHTGLSEMLEKLQKAEKGELLGMLQEFDTVMEPNAQMILKTAQDAMAMYYEKQYALEVVADFMQEQNYQVDWARPAGDDPSQKLVVHFTNLVSKNTISIILDSDMSAEEAGRMAMEILFFYDKGREVSEEEKKRLRENLSRALHDAGIGGSLSCTGAVGQASERRELNDEASVAKLQPEPLFQKQRIPV